MLESIALWLFFLFNYVLLLKLQNQKIFHPSPLIMDRAYPSTIMHVNREEDGSCKPKMCCTELGKLDTLTSIALHYT